MSSSLGLTPEIVAYLAAANPPEHPALAKCRAETAALGRAAGMQISAEQGALMAWIARLLNARRAIEVGVFTGYSSLVVALAMREMHAGARILACDVSETWTQHARRYWAEAGVDAMIDLHLRPAVETLDAVLRSGEAGHYDLAFIDADKTGYDAYYERCLALLRPGGVLLFDNVLWDGKVALADADDPDTQALRAIARKARADARVHAVMAGVGDGLLMCLKK
ncbi:MAG: class I SAM-dependent methyltransferase [Hyphomonadaceae bacterium]|nr:class I SAM-dependent methyltransferase [Hyphomonadaceae bacterium]